MRVVVFALSQLLLGGCFTLSGTAGLTIDGTGRVGTTAEMRMGVVTALNDTTALQFTVSPGVAYDGQGFTVISLFGIDYAHQPDGNGDAFRVGARSGLISEIGAEDGSWAWGAHGAYHVRSVTVNDAPPDRKPQSGEGMFYRAWRGFGPSIDILRRTNSSTESNRSEIEQWRIHLGGTFEFMLMAQPEAWKATTSPP